MKKILVIVGILILAALGYYFLMPTSTPTDEASDTMGAKIDINAVCDGALAYMTFTDGAAAEAFVADCKEGKHPEVIEQWKVQMGIEDDRAI